MDANRQERWQAVNELARKSDWITNQLSSPTRYHDYKCAQAARVIGLRALLLMCGHVKRKRFNRRIRAYRQQLAHLEKYVPDED